MLVAMAGLPGTGKSSLSALLSSRLEGVVLNKDAVRSTLFPPPVLDYSRGQDDVCMTAIYRAAAFILVTYPRQAVFLDGRTFSRADQVQEFVAIAATVKETPRIIECVCDEAIVRERLEVALARGDHPAGNRNIDLYRALKATAEPITIPHLVLDTGKLSLDECLLQSLAYLKLP